MDRIRKERMEEWKYLEKKYNGMMIILKKGSEVCNMMIV